MIKLLSLDTDHCKGVVGVGQPPDRLVDVQVLQEQGDAHVREHDHLELECFLGKLFLLSVPDTSER